MYYVTPIPKVFARFLAFAKSTHFLDRFLANAHLDAVCHRTFSNYHLWFGHIFGRESTAGSKRKAIQIGKIKRKKIYPWNLLSRSYPCDIHLHRSISPGRFAIDPAAPPACPSFYIDLSRSQRREAHGSNPQYGRVYLSQSLATRYW